MRLVRNRGLLPDHHNIHLLFGRLFEFGSEKQSRQKSSTAQLRMFKFGFSVGAWPQRSKFRITYFG